MQQKPLIVKSSVFDEFSDDKYSEQIQQNYSQQIQEHGKYSKQSLYLIFLYNDMAQMEQIAQEIQTDASIIEQVTHPNLLLQIMINFGFEYKLFQLYDKVQFKLTLLEFNLDMTFVNQFKFVQILELSECEDLQINFQHLCLKILTINECQIKDWISLPDSLQQLNIFDTEGIPVIDNLPIGLNNILITDCDTKEVQNIPSNLIKLRLNKCKIKKLDVSNCTKLEILDLRQNDIGFLEKLPQSLTELKISYNNMKRIQDIPSGLKILMCAMNEFTQLNITQCTQLLHLDCSLNNIATINGFPENYKGIEFLDVSGNDFDE